MRIEHENVVGYGLNLDFAEEKFRGEKSEENLK